MRLSGELARDAEDATALLVSLDPAGASRLTRPIGPVVAAGRFTLV
jgi:anti-sigma-K factor RskA